MAKVRITLVKSVIDRPQRQKDTVKALGLRKVHAAIEKELTPVIAGMVYKVKHLLTIEEIN
jgi:large subunit ribosomal protein L30